MLELLLRGMAIGGMLAAGLVMLRGGRANAARVTGALFCVATCGFVINTSPSLVEAVGPLSHIAWLFSAGGTAYFWLFGTTLFSDARLTPIHAAPALLMTGIVIAGRLLPPGADIGTAVVHNILEVLLVAHVLTAIWRRRPDDLVDTRRAMRGPFMAAVGAFCLVLSGFDVAWSLGFRDPWIKETQAFALAVMALAGCWAFCRAQEELFNTPAPIRRGATTNSPEFSAADRAALDRLKALVDGDGAVWRQPGLTVGATARQVGVPEYRLRQLINRGLGYRNFSDFLNARRIEMAKVELRDPARARTQISTLAFDLGYASLGPFNRAFREATGFTPRAWRDAPADS